MRLLSRPGGTVNKVVEDQAVLDRTCFWHLMTNTPIHPKEHEVLGLLGATPSGEMLPSMLAKALWPSVDVLNMACPIVTR